MSEREPEPVDPPGDEPDFTEDPRKQGTADSSRETTQTETGDDHADDHDAGDTD